MTIPVLRDGYIQWVEPEFTGEEERYQMFGDHDYFIPVKFNDAF